MTKKNTGRAVGIVAVASVAALALSACTSGSGGAEGTDFTWAMWVSGSDDQAIWENVASTVGKEHEGTTVNLQGSPFADYWTKLNTQLGSANAPCIVSMQNLRLANYYSQLTPLDDLVEKAGIDLSAFDEGALDAMRVDGKLYAIPFDTGPLIAYYNADLLKAAGVDLPENGWTVDEFEAAAAAVAEKSGTPLLASTVQQLPLESVILSATGGRAIDDEGELTLDDPAFAEGLDWISGLVKDGYALPATGSDNQAAMDAFVAGNAGVAVDGPWMVASVHDRAEFEVGITTLPAGAGGETYSAGSGFAISQACGNKEGAAEALSSMTSEDALLGLAEAGRAWPARPAVQDAWFEANDVAQFSTQLEAALASAVPHRGFSKADQLSKLYQRYLAQAINGEVSSSDALQEIQSQIE